MVLNPHNNKKTLFFDLSTQNSWVKYFILRKRIKLFIRESDAFSFWVPLSVAYKNIYLAYSQLLVYLSTQSELTIYYLPVPSPQMPYLSPGPWGLSCGWHRRHCRAWSGQRNTERIPPARTALSGVNEKKSTVGPFASSFRNMNRIQQGSSHPPDPSQTLASNTPVTAWRCSDTDSWQAQGHMNEPNECCILSHPYLQPRSFWFSMTMLLHGLFGMFKWWYKISKGWAQQGGASG